MNRKLLIAALLCNVLGESISFAAQLVPATFNNSRIYFKNQEGNLESLPYITLTLAAEETLEKAKETAQSEIDCQVIFSKQNLPLSNSTGMTTPSVKIAKIWEVRDCQPKQR